MYSVVARPQGTPTSTVDSLLVAANLLAKLRIFPERPTPATMSSEFASVEAALEEHLPADKLAEVKRILYGNPCT